MITINESCKKTFLYQKRPSLLRISVNCRRKKFYSIEPRRFKIVYLDDPTDGAGDEGEVSESPPSTPCSPLSCLLKQN